MQRRAPPEAAEQQSGEASSGFPKHLKEDAKPVVEAVSSLREAQRGEGEGGGDTSAAADTRSEGVTVSSTVVEDREGEEGVRGRQPVAEGTGAGTKGRAAGEGHVVTPGRRQEEDTRTSGSTSDRNGEAESHVSQLPSAPPVAAPSPTRQGWI